ncbi:MAG: T9SS type A sorting domain-containing protein, partial [Flavobacteriales bacterium]
ISQYTTIFNQVWSNSTNSYQLLNLNTLEIETVNLDPVDGLVNGDVITIDVSLPNGVIDTDPSNNQTISFIVDLGFDNAYWDGDLSITVSGATNVNSWYLKKVSNGFQIAQGWGGVTGVTNDWPLEFNECYTLQSINGGGESYTITDFVGNVVLQGTVSGVEEFDNFTTGDELWTGVEDMSNSNINIYPNPVQDNLFIEGTYDYVEISDLSGRSLLISDNKDVIDVSQLDFGIYIVNIQSYDTKTSHKIQVTR